MERNIIVEIDDLKINGQLIYEDTQKYKIDLTLPISQSHYFQDLFDNSKAFILNGKLDDECKFTAFYCHIVQVLYTPKNSSVADGLIAIIDFYSNQESDRLIIYKIDIGKLYLNVSNVNEEIKVKKVDVKFSSIDAWIPENENKKVFISRNNCHISISNDFISIEVSNSVSLKQLDKIVFDLRVFFEVVLLDNDVQIIQKFIYIVDDTKIEEVMRYKKEERDSEKFLFRYDANSIENILNFWFKAKSKYGRIFDYLSGILNESSIVHLELKYFVLAQWLEAYSRELLDGEVKAIINKHIEISDEKALVLSQSQNGNNFRKNLKDMFKLKDLKTLIGIQNSEDQKQFIDQIICYRNHLTHINIESKLNNTQIMHLYEILKDIIYILIMKELDAIVDNRRIDEIKRKYMRYKILQDTIEKCKEK